MTQKDKQATIEEQFENRLIAERYEKLRHWRNSGRAYPNNFHREHLAAYLNEFFGSQTKDQLQTLLISVSVAGRIVFKRVMGKTSFLIIQDGSGRIQLCLNQSRLTNKTYEFCKKLDIGDLVGCNGVLFKTNTGELSVLCENLLLLSKCLRPIPEKFHGLNNVEQRYRKRYLDLITRKEARETFMARSRLVQSIREYMISKGFLEVETPMMHPIPGGASAIPFITHHKALNIPLFLRIAPELYLKRLVIGGFEKIFEMNRNFRNEGLSRRHNPEFTMMEFYQAYTDYIDVMNFTENLIRQAAIEAISKEIVFYQGRQLDLSQPFHRLTMAEAVIKYNPNYNKTKFMDRDWLKQELARNEFKLNIHPDAGLGDLQLSLFEKTTEDKLWEPTFVTDYPIAISPLARRSDTNKDVAERFELFIAGREIANGFSELNDPEDQAERFFAQIASKRSNNEEDIHYDAEYLQALEFGMPPTGGCGIGIDRLVMLLTDSPAIRDVILFPQMRSL